MKLVDVSIILGAWAISAKAEADGCSEELELSLKVQLDEATTLAQKLVDMVCPL